jgi:hypothetical protein
MPLVMRLAGLRVRVILRVLWCWMRGVVEQMGIPVELWWLIRVVLLMTRGGLS